MQSRNDADLGGEPLPPRRLALLYAAVLGVTLAAQAGLNWVVNPWGYYPPRLLQARVIDDRDRKCALLRRIQPPPEQLVLGSSRMMRFEPQLLATRTGLRTFNLATPGAAPVDYLVLYRYASERVKAPIRSVIVGVETPAFCGHERNHRTLAANPTLKPFLPKYESFPERLAQWQLLLSGQQTSDTWRSLRHHLGAGPRGLAGWALAPDGTSLRTEPRQTSEQRRAIQAAAIRDQLGWRYLNVDSPDPEAYRDLARFLELARRRGVQVTLVATPTLDPLLDHWKRNGFIRFENATLAHLPRIAAKYGARFVDFSRVERFNGDPAEFEDAFHPGLVNARRMIKAMFPMEQPSVAQHRRPRRGRPPST